MLSGAKYIHLFGQAENFIKKNQERINVSTRIAYAQTGCQLWMRLYLQLSSSSLIISLYFLAIVFRYDISPATAGLCITYAIGLPVELNSLIEQATDIENQMVSVERIKSYLSIPSEKPLTTPYDLEHSSWPISPIVKFNKVQLKYRPNTELVLKGLSFEIPAASRLGILGRTASEKSSIFLALLRIIELHEGNI